VGRLGLRGQYLCTDICASTLTRICIFIPALRKVSVGLQDRRENQSLHARVLICRQTFERPMHVAWQIQCGSRAPPLVRRCFIDAPASAAGSCSPELIAARISSLIVVSRSNARRLRAVRSVGGRCIVVRIASCTTGGAPMR
jgi:hypothetical protein